MSDPKIKMVETKDSWMQDNDCCDSDDCGQYLNVSTEDGGGGPFLIIETKRWAIDDIDGFCELLKKTLNRVEKSNK